MIKPWGEAIERDKIREATIGPMHAPGRPGTTYTPSSADREEARLIAEGFTRDPYGRLTVPGVSRAERYRQLVAQGINMDNPLTRQRHGFKHGGLVSLPVVKKQAGSTLADYNITPYTLPQGGLGEVNLSEMAEQDPSAQLTGANKLFYEQLQNYINREKQRQQLAESDIQQAQLAAAREQDAKKSAAIGAMLGSFAKGMKDRAGQGFGQEILGGFEQAAETSTEISEKDRAAIDAAQKELRKAKKESAKEWDKGNLENALLIQQTAQQTYDNMLNRLKVKSELADRSAEVKTKMAALGGSQDGPLFIELYKTYGPEGEGLVTYKEALELGKGTVTAEDLGGIPTTNISEDLAGKNPDNDPEKVVIVPRSGRS